MISTMYMSLLNYALLQLLYIQLVRQMQFVKCIWTNRIYSGGFRGGATRGIDPGGGGGQSPPPMEILGANILFCPPDNFDNLKNALCNARKGLKITVRHYKTIEFNIKILLNTHNFQFSILYCNFAHAQKIWNISYFCPLPLPIRKMDRRPWAQQARAPLNFDRLCLPPPPFSIRILKTKLI